MQSPEEKLKEITGSRKEAQEQEQVPDRYTFEIDVTDSRGKRFQGRFTTRAPTIEDMINVGRLKAAFLPEGAVDDPVSATLNHMTCHLAVVLESKPSWWNPYKFYTSDPLVAVHREVAAYEARFLGTGQESGAESGEDPSRDGSGQSQGSGRGVDRGPDVERSVQAPAERSETIVSNRKGSPGTGY